MAMAVYQMLVYQMLVRNLDGNTLCLGFSTSEVSCAAVKAELAVREGIPSELQRLASGTRELGSERLLVAGTDGFFPSCTLLLRLNGGKGGFGSLLRGAATKAGQKKTSNFDACRDMSGRRLRHVNAEKKLKEWKADANERELEKTAEDFLKKKRKRKEESEGVEVDLEKFSKDSNLAREGIKSAVMDGLVQVAKSTVDSKRKKVEAVEYEVKRTRTWSMDNFDDSENCDDSDDTDEEEEGEDSSDHSNEAGPSTSDRCQEGFCPTKDKADDFSSDQDGEPFRRVDGQASRPLFVPEAVEIALEYPEMTRASPTKSSDTSEKGFDGPAISNSQSEVSVLTVAKGVSEADDLQLIEGPIVSNSRIQVPSLPVAIGDNEVLDCHQFDHISKDISGPIDFDDYNTAKHLEVLGLERIKNELLAVGMKCGGSLSERAARLFLLKTISVDKLDKSLFSKPAGKASRKIKG